MSLGDDVSLDAKEAAQEGLDALRGALRELRADGDEGFVACLRRRRRRARVGNLLGAAAVHMTLQEASRCGQRVLVLGDVVRQLVLAFGRRGEATLLSPRHIIESRAQQ